MESTFLWSPYAIKVLYSKYNYCTQNLRIRFRRKLRHKMGDSGGHTLQKRAHTGDSGGHSLQKRAHIGDNGGHYLQKRAHIGDGGGRT